MLNWLQHPSFAPLFGSISLHGYGYAPQKSQKYASKAEFFASIR